MKKILFYFGALISISNNSFATNKPIDAINNYYEICQNSKKLVGGYDNLSVNNMKKLLYTQDNFGAEVFLSNCKKNFLKDSTNNKITIINTKTNKKTGELSVFYKYTANTNMKKPLIMKLKQKMVNNKMKWFISW